MAGDDVIIRIRTAFEKGGIAAAEAELLKLASAGARASAGTEGFSSRLSSLNQGLRGSALNAAQFSQKLSTVAPEIQKASTALQQFKAGLLSGIGQGIAGIFAVQAVVGFTRALTDAQLQYEKTIRTLDFATGSAAGAAQSYQFAASEANRLGLEVRAVAESYARFSAGAKGSSIDAEKVKTVFTGVINASRALSLSTSDTDRAFRALTQIIGKGKVTAEEFRGQIGDALPGATAIAAKALNVTTVEFTRLLDAGELTIDFLPKFGQALTDTFGDTAQKAVGGLAASIADLDNSFNNFFLTVSNTGGLEAQITGLKVLTEVVNTLAFTVGNAFAQFDRMRERGFLNVDPKTARDEFNKIVGRDTGNAVPGRGGLNNLPASPSFEVKRNFEEEARLQKKAAEDAEREAEKAARSALARAKTAASERSALAKQAIAEQSAAAKEAAKFEQERVDQLQEALQEEQDARDEVKKSIADQAAGIQEQIDSVNAEAEALKLGGAEGVRYAVVQREVAKAIRELGEENLSAGAIAEINKLADAQARLFTQREGENQIRDAAEQTTREFERQSDAITQTLTDAIFRGFENGKGFAENFKDTVVNLFKTLVLRPVIEAIVKPVAQLASNVIGSVVGSVFGVGGTGGGGGIFGSLITTGASALVQQGLGSISGGAGGGGSGSIGVLSGGGGGILSALGSSSTINELSTAVANQALFKLGLTAGPSGQPGALGQVTGSNLLTGNFTLGQTGLTGTSGVGAFTGGQLLGTAANTALAAYSVANLAQGKQGAELGLAKALLTSFGGVIGLAIGEIVDAFIEDTPARGFATFGASGGAQESGGKMGFHPDSLESLATPLQKSIRMLDNQLKLGLDKSKINFFIGFKKGKGYQTNIDGQGDRDFEDTASGRQRLGGTIFRQEVLGALPDKERTKFQQTVLDRAFAKKNDRLDEQLASIEHDLAVKGRLKDFTKKVNFDPDQAEMRKLRHELRDLTKDFKALRKEAKDLGLRTKKADDAFDKASGRIKDQILGKQIAKEAEKITAQQQAYQLAGEKLPPELQAAGLKAQFKVLGIQFRELGLDTNTLDQLLGKALEHLQENIVLAERQEKFTAQAQAFQLAGRQLPIELQRGLVLLQFEQLRIEFERLGLSTTILTTLLGEALNNLQAVQEQARLTVQGQAFQLAGRQVPMELQRAGIEFQFKELGEQFLELGLDATILAELLAEALANLEEAREAAKIQVQAQAYQLAGRDVPLALQQAGLQIQFAELGEQFLALGLDASGLSALLAEAIANLQEAQSLTQLQVLGQAFQLAGRDVPFEIQQASLLLQFKQLGDQFAELGLDAGILSVLLDEALINLEQARQESIISLQSQAFQLAGQQVPIALQAQLLTLQFAMLREEFIALGIDTGLLTGQLAEAIENLQDAQAQARQSALERAYQLAGEEIPKEIQIAGIMAEFKELGELFLELGLDTGILGPLLQEAIDKINKAGDDLRTGGFIGFIDEFGNISEALGNQVAANDSQFFGQNPPQAGQDPAAPSPVIHPTAPSPFSNTNPSLITSTPPWENGPPSGPRPAPVGLWKGAGGGGDVNINFNGPAVFDDITQAKFTREVGRKLRTRGARFG